jgi:hypothetical protein
MKAVWRGRVIAESDRTLDVGGYTYFPAETVRMDLLQATPKTQSDLACPHGVQFLRRCPRCNTQQTSSVVLRSATRPMSKVDHWIGFWEGRRGVA